MLPLQVEDQLLAGPAPFQVRALQLLPHGAHLSLQLLDALLQQHHGVQLRPGVRLLAAPLLLLLHGRGGVVGVPLLVDAAHAVGVLRPQRVGLPPVEQLQLADPQLAALLQAPRAALATLLRGARVGEQRLQPALGGGAALLRAAALLLVAPPQLLGLLAEVLLQERQLLLLLRQLVHALADLALQRPVLLLQAGRRLGELLTLVPQRRLVFLPHGAHAAGVPLHQGAHVVTRLLAAAHVSLVQRPEPARHVRHLRLDQGAAHAQRGAREAARRAAAQESADHLGQAGPLPAALHLLGVPLQDGGLPLQLVGQPVVSVLQRVGATGGRRPGQVAVHHFLGRPSSLLRFYLLHVGGEVRGAGGARLRFTKPKVVLHFLYDTCQIGPPGGLHDAPQRHLPLAEVGVGERQLLLQDAELLLVAEPEVLDGEDQLGLHHGVEDVYVYVSAALSGRSSARLRLLQLFTE
ncbi:hypothetical protein EYF80_057255 [Liparis tanakae]|uniref:Uncharacterized protein n=1 Tax=Liparis tanakae TaxID=230148 RepID=A0A4Z2EUX6_9TELE|nr:hypothetical protein EYF80_057255 [Liparis tanakae]